MADTTTRTGDLTVGMRVRDNRARGNQSNNDGVVVGIAGDAIHVRWFDDTTVWTVAAHEVWIIDERTVVIEAADERTARAAAFRRFGGAAGGARVEAITPCDLTTDAWTATVSFRRMTCTHCGRPSSFPELEPNGGWCGSCGGPDV